ncbi:23S ribosomal RNA methyltransferase Erm [Thermoactinomyces mirandus]|uniref:rRNA adenine N-6-methyltransferase n=1 Tax=Thermoactinomyces mirandus TaxID=2756294 RepID=A0A7W1XU75_9BACL|nr:23S ribosomal RNA methyltransferase Erm [Thermoactinomyces mirandus]MBA4603363.1 23S ribosomal RNA methyltransferase Erm [Thermoactinomyces mirandus]
MSRKIHKNNGKKTSRGRPPNFSGQHFLKNRKVLCEMVERAKVSAADTVLDLGAGKGALTTLLMQKAGKVWAVEYDARLVELLKKKTAGSLNTKIIHGDIMQFCLPKGKFVVVSNIPYAITTPIMKKLLSNPCSGMQRGIIVMEKGAARRFTSRIIKDAYVLAWRMWFDIHYIRDISRNYFSPRPSVDSAMIQITRKKDSLIPYKDYRFFLGLAEYALQNPKAPLDYALKGLFTPPQIRCLKKDINVSADIPVGEIHEEQWKGIFKAMVRFVPYPCWPKAKKGNETH